MKTPGDWIRLNSKRARTVLAHALGKSAGVKSASWRASFPPPETKAARARYEELSQAADDVTQFIEGCDAKTHAMMLDYAFLHGIAQGIEPGQWYLRHYAPVLRVHKKRRVNSDKSNTARAEAADAKLLADYEKAVDKIVFKRFLPDRQKRRLRILLKK